MEEEKKYVVYEIVLIENSQTIYVGMTSDAVKRNKYHKSKNVRATKGFFSIPGNFERTNFIILHEGLTKSRAFEIEYDITIDKINNNHPLLNKDYANIQSAESKRKKSVSHKGKKKSKEHCESLSLAAKFRAKPSEEHKKNISNAIKEFWRLRKLSRVSLAPDVLHP